MAALILILIAFAFVLKTPTPLRLAVAAGIALRVSIALINSLPGIELVGSTDDATVFWERMVTGAEDGIEWRLDAVQTGHHLFVNVYAAVLSWIGTDTILNARLLSVVAGSACICLLSRCWMLMRPGDTALGRKLVLVYAVLPSLVTNQSYVLREAWQSLAILAVVYGVLNFLATGPKLANSAYIAGGLLLGATLHHSLPITMLAIGIIAVLTANRVTPGDLVARPERALFSALALAALFVIARPLLAASDRFQQLARGEIFDARTTFIAGAERGAASSRAFYGTYGGPLGPLRGFIAYITYPLPPLIGGSVSDLILFAENVVRMAMLWYWWRARRLMDIELRWVTTRLFAMWFVVEAAWSLGTVNWGTASRHHSMSWSILLLVGFMAISLLRENDRPLAAPTGNPQPLPVGRGR